MFQRHHHQEAIPDTSVPALAPMAAPQIPPSFVSPDSELHEDRKPVRFSPRQGTPVPSTEPSILSTLNQGNDKQEGAWEGLGASCLSCPSPGSAR